MKREGGGRVKRGGKRRQALGHDEPFRTCVGTRQSGPREELLRFVRAPDGTLGFDVTATLAHRGAWTLPSVAAIARAVDRGSFARAFAAPVLAQADALTSEVDRILTQEILKTLGLLRRQNGVVAGRTEVQDALQAGRQGILLLAQDLSDRSRQESWLRAAEQEPWLRAAEQGVETQAASLPAPIDRVVSSKSEPEDPVSSQASAKGPLPPKGTLRILPGPKMEVLGSALGRSACGVLLVTAKNRLSKGLARDLTRLARLRNLLPQAPALAPRANPTATAETASGGSTSIESERQDQEVCV